MEKFVPYANLRSRKNKDGNIEAFVLKTVIMLPEDSKVKLGGGGKLGDNVILRPVKLDYSGNSKEFKLFEPELIIKRDEIGILERGLKLTMNQYTTKNGDEEGKGIIIDYT